MKHAPRHYPLYVVVALYATTFALVLLSGCTPTKTITKKGKTPPPSVVSAPPETLKVASDPDLLFLPDVPDLVIETYPITVTEYLTPRPDTTEGGSPRSFRLWSLSADSTEICLYGQTTDTCYAVPEKGERLVCTGEDGQPVCHVEGEPVAGPNLTFNCPDPGPFAGRFQNVKVGLFALLFFVLGFVVRSWVRL